MYSKCTQRTYDTSVSLFDKFANKRHTLIQFRNYIDSIRNKSQSTIKTRFYAIQNYFLTNGISTPEDIKRVVKPFVKSKKTQKRLTKYLTQEQLDIYRNYVNTNIKKSERLKTLLLLLPYTGLRIGEITNLRKNNIFINNNNWFLVFIGKGNKERKVPLNTEAKEILSNYLKTCNFYSDNNLLFPISPDAVRDSIRGFKDKINMNFLTPHILRHTFATLLLQKGVDITTISQLMGHSSPVITLNIYSHTNEEKMLEAVNAF